MVVGLTALAVGAVQAYRVVNGRAISDALLLNPELDLSAVNHNRESANIQAFLWMIRRCEGTHGSRGYNTLFGYEYFDDFSSHPNRKICKNGICSTAAGAYQILYSTWLLCRLNVSGLDDFSPINQDKAATWLLKHRGVLDLVKAGRVEDAIMGNGKRGNGANWEWASLPGSPYGQPVRTMSEAISYYQSAGGVLV